MNENWRRERAGENNTKKTKKKTKHIKDGKYLYKAGFNYERACKYVKLLAITYPVG